jgi:methionine synthase II (cobalamin-independent)
LFEAGAPVVQLTEPALGEIDPDDRSALDQLESVLAAMTAEVVGHLSLAVAGGRATGVPYGRLFAAPFASYLFDLIHAPDDWLLCARVPATSGLIVGVADARTPDPDTEAVSIWSARYAASLAGRGPSRVGISTSAGLESLPRDAARAKLAALAEAGRKAVLPDAELARVIDPRAVDARTAALGRYDPRPPRG